MTDESEWSFHSYYLNHAYELLAGLSCLAVTATVVAWKWLKVCQPVVQTAVTCEESSLVKNDKNTKVTITIFFASQMGHAKTLAQLLKDSLLEHQLNVVIRDLNSYDPEDLILDETHSDRICIFLVSTYVDGQPPDAAKWFYKWLRDITTDFRMHKSLLKGLKYAVFGLGDSSYGKKNFNRVARRIDRWLVRLQASKLLPLALGNQDSSNSQNGGLEEDFAVWREKLVCRLQEYIDSDRFLARPHKVMHEEALYDTSSDEEFSGTDEQTENEVMDVEDLGLISSSKIKQNGRKAEVTVNNRTAGRSEPKEMITPQLREVLTKQGYHLVGSHSGVKLCRWTKSMLRGRGGCYKHTFYGIESHRCMETTPSLACANKCVFCWRHHSNPVGTEWRWKFDPPEEILKAGLEGHYQMIKQFKGVPGVKLERMQEGMQVQHCALSLVGEPIMYPEINRFITLLHSQQISSFLVTNAQFPDAIRNLSPVTQLYVSVDASTKESLKKIDRPLFQDFWTRFLDCLKALSEKGQRTVYRLTLVKAFNVEEVEAYARLVSIGKPDFIEVKGVTYCGTSKASHLTMENVPWHEEVLNFVQRLTNEVEDYEIASEHEHSNCILIAHKRFKIDKEWWTWIDYPKFHELIQEFNASAGTRTFTAQDYIAKTPSWACFGAKERGFDPDETRWFRKSRKDQSGC